MKTKVAMAAVTRSAPMRWEKASQIWLRVTGSMSAKMLSVSSITRPEGERMICFSDKPSAFAR